MELLTNRTDKVINETPTTATSEIDELPKPVNDPAKASGSSGGSRLIHSLLIPLVLLAAGAAVVYALGNVKPDQRPNSDSSRAGRLKALPPVRVQRIRSLEETGETLSLKIDGTVVPFREARVSAEVAGQIIYKADECESGAVVRKDQLLMRIDPTDYELEVERLTRLQEQEYEALGEVDQEMANTRRLIDVGKQDVQLQQNEVDRQNSLPAGFASRGEIDRATRTLLQAKQQLLTSENQLELLKQRRLRLEASERFAATQLKVAKVNLKRTEIRAPIDGVIVSEEADLNTFVTRGSALVTIDDISKVEVAANLRMDQLYWILDQASDSERDASTGYDLPITPAIIEYEISGRQGVRYKWKGHLLSYDGIGLDTATRTVPVRIVVDDPRTFIDKEGNKRTFAGATPLVRGMFVEVKLLIQPKTPFVVIPANALKPGNRVWQFEADESVIDATPGAIESGIPKSAAPLKTVPGELTTHDQDDSFNPNEWLVGRVIVHENIIPVDILARPVESVGANPAGVESTMLTDGDSTLWVCEARDQSLVDGSFVVVSPLGSIESQSVPARAMLPSITEQDTPPGTDE